MENIADKILIDREKKDNLIKSYTDSYQVVSLKANIPGINKNIKEAFVIVSIFDKQILKYNPLKRMYFDSYDGPYIIYLFNKNKNLKKDMIKIESKNKLARFIDVDVFLNQGHSLNRSKPRTCYICNDTALICSRMKRHSTEQLLKHIEKVTSSYLKRLIKKMINEAMLKELNLHPKFGLVTPLTNGSHKDMDYNLMINAKNAILDDLVEMFMLGYTSNLNIDELFIETRKIGIKADKHMFEATNNVNAYQGLIFNLGLVLVNLGKALKENLLLTDVFNNIKLMSKNFINEGNFGARKQASDGYQIIQNLLYNDISNMNTLDILIYFINNLDDTVLLRRCKDQKVLRKIKEEFKHLDSSKKLLINQVNNDCIKNNLSFGGCADLLVVSIFIDNFAKLFNKIYSYTN